MVKAEHGLRKDDPVQLYLLVFLGNPFDYKLECNSECQQDFEYLVESLTIRVTEIAFDNSIYKDTPIQCVILQLILAKSDLDHPPEIVDAIVLKTLLFEIFANDVFDRQYKLILLALDIGYQGIVDLWLLFRGVFVFWEFVDREVHNIYMLRNIIRKSFVAKGIVRGHGWERPDVPLIPAYVHKRRHLVTDIGDIWTDYAQPEYVLTEIEATICGTPEGLKTTATWWGMYLSAVAALGLTVGLLLHNQKRAVNQIAQEDYQESLRFSKERLLHKYLAENPFGINATPQKGILFAKYGATNYLTNAHETYVIYQQINAQACEFVNKKLLEARQEVASGKVSHHH